MEQGGALISSLFTLRRIAYSIKEDRNDMAGFCSPRTMEIIARERGISQLDITKSGGKSKIVVGMSKNRG